MTMEEARDRIFDRIQETRGALSKQYKDLENLIVEQSKLTLSGAYLQHKTRYQMRSVLDYIDYLHKELELLSLIYESDLEGLSK